MVEFAFTSASVCEISPSSAAPVKKKIEGEENHTITISDIKKPNPNKELAGVEKFSKKLHVLHLLPKTF